MKTKLNLQIEEIALKEIYDAYEWYEEQSEGLGDKFKNALDKAFKTIQKFPDGYEVFGHHRQFPMK